MQALEQFAASDAVLLFQQPDLACGPVPIERLTTDDFVFAQDEATGQVSLRRVIDTFVRRGAPIVAVTVMTAGGHAETFRTTEEHPFYVPSAGWVRVDQLRPGDATTTLGGPEAVMVGISYTGEQAEVFNLEVEGLHDYYVGASGVLVHNSACKLRISSRVSHTKLSAKPPYRGRAPIGIDGKPIELHHADSSNPLDVREMLFTDHRGAGNVRGNHPSPWDGMSPEDRALFDRERQLYWTEQWDSGRFDGLPDR